MTKFELLPEFGQGGSQARQILYITSQAEEAKQTSEFSLPEHHFCTCNMLVTAAKH